MTDKIAAQAELLFNRLSKRYRHLKKWARRTGTNAFRLYDRDIPELPLVLDLYGSAVSGAVYKRRNESINENTETLGSKQGSSPRYTEDWLSAMKKAASRALDIPESRIFLKERQRMRQRHETGIQYNKISGQNFYCDVNEAGLCFRVNLSDYLDTGLFLDARKKRALIKIDAAGKTVLNLFAYTCSLSVAAASGGAARVDSVDLSKTYLDWGKVNFALNGLEEKDNFNFFKSDVFQFLGQAARNGSRWDLIILDPPSFSNSKKMKSSMDIRRDYFNLIQSCLPLLRPEGTLWFSSNAKGIRLDEQSFSGYAIKDLGNSLVDEDFRARRIPCCYTLKKILY